MLVAWGEIFQPPLRSASRLATSHSSGKIKTLSLTRLDSSHLSGEIKTPSLQDSPHPAQCQHVQCPPNASSCGCLRPQIQPGSRHSPEGHGRMGRICGAPLDSHGHETVIPANMVTRVTCEQLPLRSRIGTHGDKGDM
jgi:hypothetical protein